MTKTSILNVEFRVFPASLVTDEADWTLRGRSVALMQEVACSLRFNTFPYLLPLKDQIFTFNSLLLLLKVCVCVWPTYKYFLETCLFIGLYSINLFILVNNSFVFNTTVSISVVLSFLNTNVQHQYANTSLNYTMLNLKNLFNSSLITFLIQRKNKQHKSTAQIFKHFNRLSLCSL